MDLSTLVSVSGKSGLFKLIGQSKGGFLLESLDGKKTKAIVNLATTKMASLEDVTVYGAEKDIRLAEDGNALRAFFREVAPTHDESRVYASDIKKIVSWYGIIKDLGIEPAAQVPA